MVKVKALPIKKSETGYTMNKLIRALEIYLTDYVEKEECNCVLPDIQEIVKENVKGADGEEQIKYCKVLSFNYTNTYERLYLDKQQIQNSIDYIHGKAKLFNTVENNNMVLGIDEYLTDERKDRETEFIAFKKFYQRIYKDVNIRIGWRQFGKNMMIFYRKRRE